jgi:hypothetical protein
MHRSSNRSDGSENDEVEHLSGENHRLRTVVHSVCEEWLAMLRAISSAGVQDIGGAGISAAGAGRPPPCAARCRCAHRARKRNDPGARIFFGKILPLCEIGFCT